MTSGGGFVWALAPCWSCGQLFSFDPERVPSIPIDRQTNRPPDLGGAAERAEREPVCRSCIGRANEVRRQAGRPEIVILPGAYLTSDD